MNNFHRQIKHKQQFKFIIKQFTQISMFNISSISNLKNPAPKNTGSIAEWDSLSFDNKLQRLQNKLKKKKQDDEKSEGYRQSFANNLQYETKISKITEYKKAAEKMRQSVNTFKNYLNKYGQQGDNQYAYKLVLDFFKCQADAKNLEEQTRTIKLNLHRAMRPVEQIKWKQIPQERKDSQQQRKKQQPNSNIFVPVPPLPNQQEDRDSITSDDVENSKIIGKLLMQKKLKKKHSHHGKALSITKNHQKSGQPAKNNEQNSDNQVFYDSEESDQSILSLDSCEENSSEEERGNQVNDQGDSYSDSDQYENVPQFYFDQDYQQLGFQEDQDHQQLLKLFQSSLHKKEESLHRMQYSQMTKQQKEKYFKNLNKQYNKRRNRDHRASFNANRKRQGANKRVSFDNCIRVKNFNAHAKPSAVFLTNQRQQVLVRQIWEYDEE